MKFPEILETKKNPGKNISIYYWELISSFFPWIEMFVVYETRHYEPFYILINNILFMIDKYHIFVNISLKS